ncbi:DUF2383 domain-containing protein [Thiohalomonas denitrificans]|uniref:DUF2383 domain-containing protein n=1 Tax=Thiohalomonas denitrificans TaxID=415747 RepID=UPI0026E9E3C8|nr:DUF2383 domain-containing protein [Thiohalomonas denitrificans]
MSVVRDERLVELNELLVRCNDASLHDRDAAEWAQDAALTTFLEDLAEQRQAAGRELSAHIRALGDLPDALDTDRESFSRMAALLKRSFSDDSHVLSETLRGEVARLERAIAEQADRTLSTAISGPVRTSVQRLRDSARAAVEQLER